MSSRPPSSEWLFVPAEPWREAGTMDRRGFLRVAAAVGGGFVICFTPLVCAEPGVPEESDSEGPAERLNAYVRMGLDGSVTIRAPCPEIGQGVRTSLPMIVAGELGARWEDCHFDQAPADDAFGGMTVGGSDSVADYWMPLRQAGATARTLLVAVAARRLDVTPDALSVTESRVRHDPSGRSLDFGELAVDAAGIAVPTEVELFDEGLRVPVGRPTPPVDADAIVTGGAEYGLDIRSPDLLVAVIARAPVHGGRVRSVDDAAARAVPGVVDVVELEPTVIDNLLYGAVRAGVAVVATDTWSALRGREALSVTWSDGPNAGVAPAAVARRWSGCDRASVSRAAWLTGSGSCAAAGRARRGCAHGGLGNDTVRGHRPRAGMLLFQADVCGAHRGGRGRRPAPHPPRERGGGLWTRHQPRRHSGPV